MSPVEFNKYPYHRVVDFRGPSRSCKLYNSSPHNWRPYVRRSHVQVIRSHDQLSCGLLTLHDMATMLPWSSDVKGGHQVATLYKSSVFPPSTPKVCWTIYLSKCIMEETPEHLQQHNLKLTPIN